MFDLENYIASGIVESYCLGNLPEEEARALTALAAQHPALQTEIDRTLAALQIYGARYQPSQGAEDRVLGFLDQFLEAESVTLEQLPPIHRHSDARAWAQALEGLEPETQAGEFAVRTLQDMPDAELNLIWLYEGMEEEPHAANEFLESFLILEGACECNFGGQIVRFSAGDYFEVPPGVPHTIRNISVGLPYVKGVVQRRKAA